MLTVEGLTAGYGRIPVVSDISMEVEAGRITAVLGANGAGKTTLVKALSGLIRPMAGRVLLAGRDITGATPSAATRAGVRLLLDGHRVFPDLSVQDNLKIAAIKTGSRREFELLCDEYFEVFPILKQKRRDYARTLSGGQQQILALIQAFLCKPRVLLCDEPSIGIAQALIPTILRELRNFASRGGAVVLVEQQIQMSLKLSDTALVMDRGSIRLSGTASEFMSDERIRKIYMGN